MLYFTILTLLTVTSFIWHKKNKHNILADISSFITCVILAISLIVLPISYYNGMAEIERYHALKESFENSRASEVGEYERATIAQRMAEYNADIASKRYWNNTIFDVFIPDELAELEFMR